MNTETKTAIELVCTTIQSQQLQEQIKQALPPGVSLDRFTRTTLVALQQAPEAMVDVNKKSLYNAISKAAADGLMPDGREGALVVFNTRVKGTDKYERKVQWMPMVAGVIKRLAQANITIDAQVVCEKDTFEQAFGDEQKIIHKPPRLGQPRGDIIGVYAIAKLPGGATMREVMDREQVEQVRNSSRSKDSGPWVDWWPEMARKTVLRRLAKRLPILDPGIQDTIARDDELYDLDQRQPAPKQIGQDLTDKTEGAKRPAALQDVVDKGPKTTAPDKGVTTEPVAMREPGEDDDRGERGEDIV